MEETSSSLNIPQNNKGVSSKKDYLDNVSIPCNNSVDILRSAVIVSPSTGIEEAKEVSFKKKRRNKNKKKGKVKEFNSQTISSTDSRNTSSLSSSSTSNIICIDNSVHAQVETKSKCSCSDFIITQTGKHECSYMLPSKDPIQPSENRDMKSSWNKDSNMKATAVSAVSLSSASSTAVGLHSDDSRSFEIISVDGDQIFVKYNGSSTTRKRKLLSLISFLATRITSHDLAPKNDKDNKNQRFEPANVYSQIFYGKGHILSSMDRRQQGMESINISRQRTKSNVGCLQTLGKEFEYYGQMTNAIPVNATSPFKKIFYPRDGIFSSQLRFSYKYGYLPLKVLRYQHFLSIDQCRRRVHAIHSVPNLFSKANLQLLRTEYLPNLYFQESDRYGTSEHMYDPLECIKCTSQGNGPFLELATQSSDNSTHISLSPEKTRVHGASSIRKEECHTQTNSGDYCGEALTDTSINVLTSGNDEKGKFVDDRMDYFSMKSYKMKKSSMYIASKWAEQALISSFKLRKDSSYATLMAGCPIADIDNFLSSASPVIVPSLSTNAETDFFFTIQEPSIALSCIWSWYEMPGSYGLEVKAREYQNFGRSESLNESYDAYFVPYLSAIQLFGNQGTTETVQPKEDAEKSSLLSSFQRNLCLESFTGKESSVHSIDKVGASSSITTTNQSELIFEFFENELPHLRMPLYAKVKHLINYSASNQQTFGNASSLECMNLQDLHPSSWFSVAWYPIYRIPAGKLRSTFLTYHSLGHFTLNPPCSSSSKQDVICPVLGMLTIYAKNGGWFNIDKKAHSSVEASKMLQDKISNLMQTASLFATARTGMNNVQVQNVHNDFRFFLSRQC